jgi:integrase
MVGDQKLPRIPGADSVYWDGRGFVTAVFNFTKPDGSTGRRPIRARTPLLLKKKARDFLMKREATGMTPEASPTVEQWMNHWLDDIAPRDVRPKTLANYRSMSKNHVVKHIGRTRLDQLTPASIRGMNDKVLKATSSTTALTVYRMLSSALTAAEREGRVARNYARVVKPPRRDIPNIEPLTVEEAGALIQTFSHSERAYLWATYLLTGARRGEILGLQWDRVTDVLDLEWQLQRHQPNMTPPVDYEHQHLGRGLYLTRPKSKAGVRVVPLVPPLAGILEHWRSVAPPNEHNLVFVNAAGRPIDPDEATRAWQEALHAAGITRRVRLHDARHTAIDLMVEAGVDEDIIREIVGHSTLMMTRAYRSRSTRKRLARGLEPFSALFSPPGETDTRPAIGA